LKTESTHLSYGCKIKQPLFVPDIGNCYYYHFITRLIHVHDRSKTH